jgi:hypothetical protein
MGMLVKSSVVCGVRTHEVPWLVLWPQAPDAPTLGVRPAVTVPVEPAVKSSSPQEQISLIALGHTGIQAQEGLAEALRRPRSGG